MRTIKDKDGEGPDGQTIKARIQERIKQTATDIKECANACDTYSKKNLVVKVLNSSDWDDTLKKFIALFAAHRKAFIFALSIHIAVVNDDTNRKIDKVDAKISMVLTVFSNIMSPEQQEIDALVQKKGGPTEVKKNNDAMKEMLKFLSATAPVTNSRGRGRDGVERNNSREEDDLAVVKQELSDTPELAIERNWEAFEGKFKMQLKALEDSLGGLVRHEGDRVIEAVTAGPHDRIIDPVRSVLFS